MNKNTFPQISGIYTWTNLINNKLYVGYCINFHRRHIGHLSALKNNRHDNDYLQKAWNKYGEENFVFEILEECSIDYLSALEHYWATILNTHNREKGYNIKPTNPNGLCTGHSVETGNKIRMSKKGIAPKRNNYKHSEETKEKIKQSVTLNHPKRKALRCVTDGKIFKSVIDAASYYNISIPTIYAYLNKSIKIRKLEFEYL